MVNNKQSKAPIYEALKKHRSNRVLAFDVPGHKGGRGNKELTEFLGENCMKADVNSMRPLDNLCHPTTVIRDAEILASEAFGASEAYFMVSGTTGSVQAMLLSTLKEGDEVIMPRNVHRSAINALILCGAKPIYINPCIHETLGIPLGMSLKDIENAIKMHPKAKAVFVNNPTYYGVCSNLKAIVELAHSNNVIVLVDEAHGTHFYFGDNLPLSAMQAGADMAAVSMHKTGGSLTQSSFLLMGENVNTSYVRQVINLTQTTSGSYLLLTSLDLARKNLALHGKGLFKKTLEIANYARGEVNKLGGYYAYAKELLNGDSFYDFDETKLSIHTQGMGLCGIEVYDILRDEYGIQVEFGDIGNILAIISHGDTPLEIENLLSALAEIKRVYGGDEKKAIFHNEYVPPIVKLSPKEAFYSEKKVYSLKNSEGKISGEFAMCYPPGIPILAPGEVITKEIIEYIEYAKEKGCLLTGMQDMAIENILCVEG